MQKVDSSRPPGMFHIVSFSVFGRNNVSIACMMAVHFRLIREANNYNVEWFTFQ